MLRHRAGYPVYVPTPYRELPVEYRKRGIRIGDVGVFTPDGAFDFLFNICKPEAGNPTELPDEFELLESDIRSNCKYAAGTSLTSDHVEDVTAVSDCDW